MVLYVFHGVAPSPRIENKFNLQLVYNVHGKEYIYKSLGTNAERRHRHFKAFFATQDPVIDPPKRGIFPNWKVRPMLTWPNYIYALIWILGLVFLVDEMAMGFKGRHKYQKQITYKAEGGGFQEGALFQEGFTYQVYMRNDMADSKYLRQGISPLHSRVISLFDSVKDYHHQCAM